MNTKLLRLLAALAVASTALACTAPSPAGPGTAAPASAAGAPPASQTSAAQSQPHGDHGDHGDHGTPTGPVRQDPLPDGATSHYGAAFTSDAAPIPLTEAIATCADTGTPCKVSGTIERVCQNSGCWFTLAAPEVERTVRVRMLDYGFLVPRNVAGASAVIEGTLARTVIPQEMAQHYADDEAAAGSGPARAVAGPEDTFEFTITGAQISRL